MEALKQEMKKRKRASPLYRQFEGAAAKAQGRPFGYEEWQGQPSDVVNDEENVAKPPTPRVNPPTPEEAMRTLGQFKANAGRDMPIKWRSIKTVGTKV